MASLLLALIYISFIGLGLPDSLLGSSWPVVHLEMGVPMSYAGIVSAVIFGGTVLTSLFSGKLLCKFLNLLIAYRQCRLLHLNRARENLPCILFGNLALTFQLFQPVIGKFDFIQFLLCLL